MDRVAIFKLGLKLKLFFLDDYTYDDVLINHKRIYIYQGDFKTCGTVLGKHQLSNTNSFFHALKAKLEEFYLSPISSACFSLENSRSFKNISTSRSY